MLSDSEIEHRLASKIKELRLKQNCSQQQLAEMAGVSLSTIIRVENQQTMSVDSLIRILRSLGKLEVLMPLLEEEPISPTEYYKISQNAAKSLRKRASKSTIAKGKENTPW